MESRFSIYEETQETEILGGCKSYPPNAKLLMVQCHPIIKSLTIFIPKTTLRNITLTLQKHYENITKHYETLRNCVMLGNRRDKQVRE